MATYSIPVLDRLARRQHGLVTVSQLCELGVTRHQIDQLCAVARLIRIRRGVYRLCGVAPSWRSMALAAVLAAGDGAVLSHRSAAILWGMFDHRDETGPLELTTRRLCRLEGVRAHRHGLTPTEVTARHHIPVTTAERTLLDLAESLDLTELGRACDEALRRRIVTLGRLHGVASGHEGSGRRRLHPMHAVLADRIPGYDPGANAWEQRMDRQWDRLGLPPAERQYRIRIGRRTYRPDRAIVDLKIAVDWNGYDPHGLRGNVDRDSDRRAELAAAGWYPLDFTSRSRPDLICRSVLAVVAERRALFGLAG
jgi:hypothetical protein